MDKRDYYLQKRMHAAQHLVTPKKIAECKEELKEKSLITIEKETAIKWAARFVAALELGLEANVIENYKHEAIEHAALAGSAFLSQLVKEIGEANNGE